MNGPTVCVLALFVLLTAGCGAPEITDMSVYPDDVRVIPATRITEAPVLDGKLDDPCWAQAREVTDFLRWKSDTLAEHQSFAYVCYDDSYLYIGVKCIMPAGVKPRGKVMPHDGDLWADDVVEIMLDPGNTRSEYYQLAINAYGTTFDCSRLFAGMHEDDAWNGEWVGKSHIGDGYYSVETAIPFHNLGITSGTGSTWGINICREGASPEERSVSRALSSIAADGVFNEAKKFAVLTGMNVDFSRYFFKIGPAHVVLDAESGNTRANRFRITISPMQTRPWNASRNCRKSPASSSSMRIRAASELQRVSIRHTKRHMQPTRHRRSAALSPLIRQ